jgi:hypothetical protein
LRISDGPAEARANDHGTQRLGARLTRLARLTSAAVVAVGCGGGEPEAVAPIERESPAEQILRVGKTWEARWAEQGFRTAPSPISLFDTRVTSRLFLARGKKTAREAIVFEGSFKLQNGTAYSCRGSAETTVSLAFGDRAGEAAVEVLRKALRVSRTCDKPGFPEPEFTVPEARARFALRGDKLVGFDPPTERREYLPVD